MKRYLLLLAALAACSSGAEQAHQSTASQGADTTSAAGAVAQDSGRSSAPAVQSATPSAPAPSASAGVPSAGAAPAPGMVATSPSAAPPVVRGLYVNRFAAQSSKRMRHLIGIADSTEINALIIDVKDEFGLNIPSQDPLLQKNAGASGVIPNVKALLDTIRAHGILPVARIVVFKDSVAARANPDHVIRKADGSAWRDKQGLTWVNPYDEAIWEYNFRVAEEAVRLGFGEVQFDYIRFPEPYKSLPAQVFPNQKGRSKPQVLADFLQASKARLDKLGVRTTADIFGLVTTVQGALEIGQEWEKLAPVTDVLLPMTYPSHYPRGSLGVANPNGEPYEIVVRAIRAAKARNDKLGITGERVRPWIQAFTLGKPPYDASHIEAQKKAIYDAGYQGWVLWHPGSSYDIFVPGLEKAKR